MLALLWIRGKWFLIPRFSCGKRLNARYLAIQWLRFDLVWYNRPLAVHTWRMIDESTKR